MESILPTLRTRLIKHSLHRGVTVVELLVVLGIIGILTTVIVTSHATFNKTILLTYTAYDVALTIRSAETFGLGSRVGGAVSGSNVGYGVHFTPGSETFVLFADTNAPGSNIQCHPLSEAGALAPDAISGDCAYQDSETVQSYKLGNGMKVNELFWSGPSGSVGSLDIVFARPNPQAFISADGSYAAYASACIELTSPQGGGSHIKVERTGQISVHSGFCPGTQEASTGGPGSTGSFD